MTDTMTMADISKSSMTLQGISSGLTMNLSAASGVVSKSASVVASSGYDITRAETKDGLEYEVISIADSSGEKDPPSITIVVEYTQAETVEELDLDIRYTDIPSGTDMAVNASNPTFSISRQPIEGSSLIGSSDQNVAPFTMTISVDLWITNPGQLQSTSSLLMTLSKIDAASGGPVKKVVLQQIKLNLATN